MLADPGDRQPAPGPLRLVQAFVNTLDTENGIDELENPAALRSTLVEIGVLPANAPELGDSDLRTAIDVREALRALALANNGTAAPANALATLERTARSAHLTLEFVQGRSRLVPTAPGLDQALGLLVGIVHEATIDGTWARLKACRRDVCHWLFYDRSRNSSSRWCAMTVCGNRTNTRAYRRRTKANTPLELESE